MLDETGAVEALPALSLIKPSKFAATCTDDATSLAPLFALVPDKLCQFEGNVDHLADDVMQDAFATVSTELKACVRYGLAARESRGLEENRNTTSAVTDVPMANANVQAGP